MNETPHNRDDAQHADRLTYLVDRYISNTCNDAELAELNDQLLRDPLTRDRFVNLVMQDRLLRDSFMAHFQSDTPQLATDSDIHGPPVTDAASAKLPPLPFFSLNRRTGRYALAASLILCFGVLASVFNIISVQNRKSQDLHIAVATLTETVEAVFDVSDVPTTAGSQLPGGFLRLKSGTAKIAFFGGAEVTLQGPCEFGLNSEMRGFLKQGKIIAYCPPKAHGFTVGAPGFAVVDLGTRFRMRVDTQGKSEVRVLEGRVQMKLMDAKGAGERTVELHDMQGMQRSASGEFAELSIDTNEADEAGNQRNVEYRKLVLESRPLGYWPLSTPDGQTPVANLMSNHWMGKWIGREGVAPITLPTGIEFSGEEDIKFDSMAALGSLHTFTVEAWVWIDPSLQHLGRIISAGATSKQGWGLGYWPKRDTTFGGTEGVMFTLYGVRDFQFSHPVPTARWVHLAVVFEETRAAQLYINGELIETIPEAARMIPATGRFDIGRNSSEPREPWLGRLSDIAVYDKKLDAQILLQHAQKGVPP